jgi:hypothetical protein
MRQIQTPPDHGGSMSTKHISRDRIVAAPALGAMLVLLLASGEAHASGDRDPHAARGKVVSGLASGLGGIRAADARGRGKRAPFQTHC